jgi:hypothetical protein
MLNILIPILLTLSPMDTTKVKIQVINDQPIQTIGGRDVTFGVKETVEELLLEKGYILDDSLGVPVQIKISDIYSPQQVINIMGIQWLKKDYFVETHICMTNSCFKSVGVRKTFIFTAFLDVENNEVPLNRKAFSKALQESLIKTTKQL